MPEDYEGLLIVLRDALVVLSLPPDEQIRVNGPCPVCIPCELLNDFDTAWIGLGQGNPAELPTEQIRLLTEINAMMDTMQEPDFGCFNNDVLQRPVWQRLRELAAEALQCFGWENAVIGPFIEVEQVVWHRPPSER